MLKNSLILPTIDINSTRANFLWAISLQAIEKAAGYVALAVLTRALDKEQLGLMFFAATISSLCATVLTFGTDTYLVRTVSADPPNALENFSRILSVRIVNAVLLYAVLNTAFALIDPALLPILLVVSGYDFLEEIYYTFSSFFAGQKRLIFRLLVAGAFEILTMAGVSAVAILTRSLFPVLFTYVLLDAVLLIVVTGVVRKYFGAIRFIWSRQDSLKLLGAASPFFLLNFLTLVHMRFDTVLVGILLDFKQVANYELGIKLLEVTRFLVRPVTSVFLPVFTEYVVGAQWIRLRNRFWQLIGAVFVLGLLIYLGMQLFGSSLIVWMFGANYADSILPAQTLFISVPLLYVSYVATVVASAMHLEKQAAAALVCSVVLNIGLDLFVIRAYGINGAAWATVASQALLVLIMLPMIVLRFRREPQLATPVPEAGEIV